MEEQSQTDKNKSLTEVNSQSNHVLNGSEPMSFFKKDKNFVFAHQKIEKLIAAVYMITDFLPSEEPIKWALRDLCMKVLHQNIDLKNSTGANQKEKERELRELSLEIVSLLEVGMLAGLVSSMNLSILKREFHGLLEHVEKTLSRQNLKESFTENSFFTQIEGEMISSNPHQKTEVPSRNIHTGRAFQGNFDQKGDNLEFKDKKPFSSDDFYNAGAPHGTVGYENSPKTPKLKEFGPVAVKKNKRQSIIIGLLKKKKEIMVGDVSEIIHDCSEKTIQRELLSLVSQGILGKVGERRWTHYYLATAKG